MLQYYKQEVMLEQMLNGLMIETKQSIFDKQGDFLLFHNKHVVNKVYTTVTALLGRYSSCTHAHDKYIQYVGSFFMSPLT